MILAHIRRLLYEERVTLRYLSVCEAEDREEYITTFLRSPDGSR